MIRTGGRTGRGARVRVRALRTRSVGRRRGSVRAHLKRVLIIRRRARSEDLGAVASRGRRERRGGVGSHLDEGVIGSRREMARRGTRSDDLRPSRARQGVSRRGAKARRRRALLERGELRAGAGGRGAIRRRRGVVGHGGAN